FPVKRAGNDIPPANAEIRQYRTQLRQITDRRIPACRRLPEDLYLSDAGRQQAKNCAHQRGLACAIWPKHADELAGLNSEADVRQHCVAGNPKRDMVESDRVHEFGPLNALSRTSSSPRSQSWNFTFAGMVSVTPITGILARLAMSRSRSVNLSDTWLL